MLSKIKIIATMGALLLAGCKNVVIEIPVQDAGIVSLTLQNPDDQVTVEETAEGTKYTIKENATVTFNASGVDGNEFEQWLFGECADKLEDSCETVVTKNIIAAAQFGTSRIQKIYLASSDHGSLHFPKLESANYFPTGTAANTNLKSCENGPDGELCAAFSLPLSGEAVKLHVRAAPESGYVLEGWSSNCTPEVFELFCEFDSNAPDRVISATFRPIDGERLTLKQVPIADKEWALLYWYRIVGLQDEYADNLTYIPGLQYRPGAIGSEYGPLATLQGVEFFPQATFVGAYIRQDTDYSALAASNITHLALATGFDTFDTTPQGGKFDMSRLPSLPLLEQLDLTTFDTEYHSAGFVPNVEWPELPNLKRIQIESIVSSIDENIFTFSNFQQFPSLESVALIGAISQESVNAVGDGGYPFVTISTDNSTLSYDRFYGGSWQYLDIWPKQLQTSIALIESRENAESWTLSVGGEFYNQLISMFPDKASHLVAY